MREFVQSVISYAVAYQETRKQKIIGLKALLFVLKRRGTVLVGAEQYQKKSKKTGNKGGKGKK